MNKRDQATLDIWCLMCDYNLGKSNNRVIRDMYVLAYEVLVDDTKYVNLMYYSAKFIKLLTKFKNKFNQENKLRLVSTTNSDKLYVFITKSALIEFSWYLLIHKNFIKKLVYVEDILSKTYNN